MNTAGKKEIFVSCLQKNRAAVRLFVCSAALNAGVFFLYRLPPGPFLYAEAILLFGSLFAFAWDYAKEAARIRGLEAAAAALENGSLSVPEGKTLAERKLTAMLLTLEKRAERYHSDEMRARRDAEDFATEWVHEIKTPVAVLRMSLKEADATVLSELLRIEQYAEMALSYIRLGSVTNDLVIGPCELDEVVRESVRRFAPQFISGRVKLTFEPSGASAVTDRKWCRCILDQLISNAVKYTPEGGGVTVRVSTGFIAVEDTGCGIKEEDLPRVFEKGYTGLNGRRDMRASGLGLYLAARAAALINARLTAESREGEGSRFTLFFPDTEQQA